MQSPMPPLLVLPLLPRPRSPRAGRRARESGLTLVELLMVVAVLGVLATAGLPSLGRTLDSSAVAAQSRELCAALRFARAEALRRGTWVTVCARQPGVEPPACAASNATGWQPGWLVFVDVGDRGRVDADDQLLRLETPLARSSGVDGTLRAITFGAAGVSVDAASHFLFRAPDAAVVQLVCVSKTGRPRLAPPGRTSCGGGS
jgi:type IV fimbrial biogenesis protein FimT